MTFAKHTTTPPPFDAAAAAKAPTSSAWEKFPEWKRWVEATGSQDGKGIKDVVEANALGLDKLKADLDEHSQRLAIAEQRLTALEARPAAGFPFLP